LFAVAMATLTGWFVGGAALAFVAVVVLVAGLALGLALTRGRSTRLLDAALPDAVEAMARSLRSGTTLAQALREVASATPGPLGAELDHVCAAVDAGRPLVTVLDDWSMRAATPSVGLVVAAVSLSAETGGAAARALDGVAATVRANQAILGELRAQSSQARLSALVIALAPLAFGGLALLTDRGTADFLLRTPLGLGCLTVGLGLDALAAWWMQRITAAASP
jgi:tight adherence protein B